MNHYGISAIHWNEAVGEVDEVLLHKFVRHERDGVLVIKHGEPAWCSDVVSLIRSGDMMPLILIGSLLLVVLGILIVLGVIPLFPEKKRGRRNPARKVAGPRD